MSNINDTDIEHPAAGPVRRPPPRAAYALPTLFTVGNIFLGYLSIVRTIQGALHYASQQPSLAQQDFEVAAKTIGFAVVLDGLDGRIARMTNTTSEFGRELDSLADVISFGIAPAILAYVWGVMFVTSTLGAFTLSHFQRMGELLAFTFLACARPPGPFQHPEESGPEESRPSQPKIFRGITDSRRRRHGWHCCVRRRQHAADGYRVVDRVACASRPAGFSYENWRYWSFKDLNLARRARR